MRRFLKSIIKKGVSQTEIRKVPGVSGALKIKWEYYIVFYNSGI